MIDCIVVGIGGLINIAGSFLIGIVAALAMKTKSPDSRTVLFLKVGICGGFTTFSSFALETADLMKDGKMHLAAIYTVLSVAFGILAVFAGQGIVRKG